MVTLEEGSAAARLARSALEAAVPAGSEEAAVAVASALSLPPLFEEKRGLFVTLLTYPSSELRGCIGFTEPPFRLREGIPRAAFYAATEDPRFPPMVPEELGGVRVDVSLLTRPVPLVSREPAKLPTLIKVGRDGLMVEEGGSRGLLLPNVAVEEGWDAETFLAHTCRKAGLSPSAWRRSGVRFWTFRSEIFGEETPRGRISPQHPRPPERMP